MVLKIYTVGIASFVILTIGFLSISGILASSAIMCLLLIQCDDADVPKLATSSMVPPNLNKLPVVGQTPYKAAGPDPQHTPTPLHSNDRQTPLQIYETDRPFFGSAPVGGLDILCSKQASPTEQSPCYRGCVHALSSVAKRFC